MDHEEIDRQVRDFGRIWDWDVEPEYEEVEETEEE